MAAMQTILHPTDFSTQSQRAFELACTLARAPGAGLIILHVVPPQVVWREEASDIRKAEHYEQDLKSYREEAQAKLERFPVPALALRAERLLGEGDPATVILDTARQHACGLIVMGTHGWTGEARRLMGSVTEEVSRKATCGVVAVKEPLVAAEPAAESAPEEAGVIL